jgi:hypothetical protein
MKSLMTFKNRMAAEEMRVAIAKGVAQTQKSTPAETAFDGFVI